MTISPTFSGKDNAHIKGSEASQNMTTVNIKKFEILFAMNDHLFLVLKRRQTSHLMRIIKGNHQYTSTFIEP